jgi:hypothetical protein
MISVPLLVFFEYLCLISGACVLIFHVTSWLARQKARSSSLMDPIVFAPGSFQLAIQGRSPLERAVLSSNTFGTRAPANKSATRGSSGTIDAAIAFDSGLFIAGVIAQWDRVDGEVFQAVSQLTHADVHSFADLYTLVHERGYDLASSGFFYDLRGHIGEWEAIKHFANFAPSMATSAQQPGWDFALGDHGLVNVKVAGDATQTLSNHFGSYPDISVVLNGDAAHIPANALWFDPSRHFDPAAFSHGHVIVDPFLTAVHTGVEASNAIDALQHPVPLHFPWVTLAVSSIVEGNLLARGRTTLGRAAKNVTVTTTGVTTGSVVGKFAGGAFGAIFGPPGILAGGIAGGIAGAFVGRMFAREVNLMPLKAAEEAFRRAELALRRAAERESKRLDEEWTLVMRREDDQLSDKLNAIGHCVPLQLKSSKRLADERFHELTLDMHREVLVICKELDRGIDRLTKSARYFSWARKRLPSASAEVEAYKAIAANCAGDFVTLGDLLGAVPNQSYRQEARINALLQLRAWFVVHVNNIATTAISEAAIARQDAVNRLEEAWADTQQKLEKLLEPMTGAFADAKAEYKREQTAAGR